MSLPKLIDNQRNNLSIVLNKIAKDHTHLSIATGYWDILGTLEIIDSIEEYESIRLIIGQEPIYNSYLKKMGLSINIDEINARFPDSFFKTDLEEIVANHKLDKIREAITTLSKLLNESRLHVKVFKKPLLHAKAYIFGDYSSDNAIGIVGSSNFTGAGLSRNAELNSLEDDYRIVTYKPSNDTQENGHLSWFDSYWNHPDAIEWSGDFKELLQSSPVGDLTYGSYDVYIKTLMEVYPDELLPPMKLSDDTSDILYAFQNRNAGILINKLNKRKMAILSDSVGLGKTITAGAVIKHYLEQNDGKANIQIIPPAALKQQWIDDLASVLGVDHLDGAYNIISQQDINALERLHNDYKKEWRKTKNIDLFVIDEAHNLRNKDSKRNQAVLNLLQQHPKSHVLLITATPINNALLDIVNLIQLAAKGDLSSIPVSYVRPNGKDVERIDFYDAIKKIQTQINRAKTTEEVEKILERVKPTIHEGLIHYLVRSTRQGVETEGGIVDKEGNVKRFPVSKVESIEYKYDENVQNEIFDTIYCNVDSIFEGINPLTLNLNTLSTFTQQSLHPLDFIKEIIKDSDKIFSFFDVEDNNQNLQLPAESKSVIVNILQAIYLLGFAPYKPLVYQHRYYGKNISDLRAFNQLPPKVAIQLVIHNLLHVTWLKRLESSPFALYSSLKNYRKRLELFEKYLEQGFIISLKDAQILEDQYDGEDIEKAFADYEESLRNAKNGETIYGVEKVEATEIEYNVTQLKTDIKRDLRIVDLLQVLMLELADVNNDEKMKSLANHISRVIEDGKYGSKVLVFSFFADTINYLKDNFHKLMEDKISDFSRKSEFLTGNSNQTENIVGRFSPISKKYTLNLIDDELNFLFATDVLSEGQNLQDAAYLVNYDLHWNPVRMIQRNGRINRIGSNFESVLVGNMKPTSDLELYLNLVHRLESKINTIRNTVGLDQSILNNTDVNPIDFIERYYEKGELPELDDDFLAHTDSHINNLRKYLGINATDSKDFIRVSSIPKGKWNYLPKESDYNKNYLALVNVKGQTVESKHEFEDKFFVEIREDNNELKASYVDHVKALDVIEAKPEDNIRQKDTINVDRKKVSTRALGEARRQAANPDIVYSMPPRHLNALSHIVDYLGDTTKIDFKGIIERGVKKSNVKRELEKILNKINKEMNEIGSVNVDTIREFSDIFSIINEEQSENKMVTSSDLLLVYSKR